MEGGELVHLVEIFGARIKLGILSFGKDHCHFGSMQSYGLFTKPKYS